MKDGLHIEREDTSIKVIVSNFPAESTRRYSKPDKDIVEKANSGVYIHPYNNSLHNEFRSTDKEQEISNSTTGIPVLKERIGPAERLRFGNRFL
jgi:hypothetical protein